MYNNSANSETLAITYQESCNKPEPDCTINLPSGKQEQTASWKVADLRQTFINREVAIDNQPARDDNELMICKTFCRNNGKEYAQVTFTIPNTLWADQIYLVGDFNDWNRTTHPLRHDRDGNWTITVDLETGRVYQFRYLIDGAHWTNDNQADAYVHNPYGTDNFVVVTDPNFKHYTER